MFRRCFCVFPAGSRIVSNRVSRFDATRTARRSLTIPTSDTARTSLGSAQSPFATWNFASLPREQGFTRASPTHRRGNTTIRSYWRGLVRQGTTFYSRLSRRRRLSICILCHKCENRSETNPASRGNANRNGRERAAHADENREL